MKEAFESAGYTDKLYKSCGFWVFAQYGIKEDEPKF